MLPRVCASFRALFPCVARRPVTDCKGSPIFQFGSGGGGGYGPTGGGFGGGGGGSNLVGKPLQVGGGGGCSYSAGGTSPSSQGGSADPTSNRCVCVWGGSGHIGCRRRDPWAPARPGAVWCAAAVV